MSSIENRAYLKNLKSKVRLEVLRQSFANGYRAIPVERIGSSIVIIRDMNNSRKYTCYITDELVDRNTKQTHIIERLHGTLDELMIELDKFLIGEKSTKGRMPFAKFYFGQDELGGLEIKLEEDINVFKGNVDIGRRTIFKTPEKVAEMRQKKAIIVGDIYSGALGIVEENGIRTINNPNNDERY